jgi:hypothetical protein
MDVPFSVTAAWGATAVFAIFFILPLRHRTKSGASRSKWCRAGLALLVGYISFAATMHHSAMQQVNQFADEARVNVLNIGALPLPPSAARWSGLISTPEGVYRLQFNELGDEPLKIQFFPNAPDNRYSDLRFYGMAPQDGRAESAAAIPVNFTFEVVFTPEGRVVSQGFRRAA